MDVGIDELGQNFFSNDTLKLFSCKGHMYIFIWF